MTTEPGFDEKEANTSLIAFARRVLKLPLYGWQNEVVEWFDEASEHLVQGSLCTPNGSGKSSFVIPTLVLGWLAMYPRGRVVLTTADGRQLDSQVMPAIEQHRGKFPNWKFIERQIVTNTGGFFVAWTTAEAGRAEGWHKIDDDTGPLLIICDEAKTISEDIFAALDRCTYNALLLTSSPGPMAGRFYESQFGRPDFLKCRIGLKDCPHVTQDKIDRLNAQYGPDGTTPNAAFLASTLDGVFMEADSQLRFNPAGLKRLSDMAEAFSIRTKAETAARPGASPVGELVEQGKRGQIKWLPDARSGWVWIAEHPEPGLEYIGFGDPMTGEQSEGSKKRDTHSFGVLRKAYRDAKGALREDEVAAVLHAPDGVRWDNDIACERFDLLLRYYGDCPAIVEANNAGTEVMRLLQIGGRKLWRRKKRDAVNPGKLLSVVGFQTNSATKNLWIGALGRAIREQELACRYAPACSQFSTFILTEEGSGEAQPHAFDDFVTGVGLALFARGDCCRMPFPVVHRRDEAAGQARGAWS